MILMTIYYLAIVVVFSHGYENLALQKSTWQSTTYDSTVGSEKAVDGLKSDFSYIGKQCSISRDGEMTASWRVDLGRIFSINNIVIYYRTDGNVWDANNHYTGRILGFYIYVSNTTDTKTGYVCFHDTYYTRSTIPAVVNIGCPVHGRYVIYYNERLPNISYPKEYSEDAYIELCEVEVFGCSVPKRYGSNCSIPCPVNCKEYCHIQTGKCFQCKPGNIGVFCDEECGGRTYGFECRSICGSCLNSKQCHHVNGSCFEGCDAGYQGSLCKSECVPGKYGVNCKDTCSKRCSMTNKCNRTTGHCYGGCKLGWTGPLCEEGQAKEGADWQSRFYGVLAALCVCLTLFVVFIVLVYFQRRSSSGTETQIELKDSQNAENSISDMKETGEKINSGYQELENKTESSTYDIIK